MLRKQWNTWTCPEWRHILIEDASSECVLAKWSEWKLFAFAVLQSRGWILRNHWLSCRCLGRKSCYGRCTWNKGLCIQQSLCHVVQWRWQGLDMGQSRIWWWQLFSPRSAQGCSAGSGHRLCICCDPGRWICCDLGQSRCWWWLLSSPWSAEKCASGSVHTSCICCHPGRWICRYMGQ